MFSNLRRDSFLDRISILFSGLCLVHCAALPMLLIVVPIASGTLSADLHFHLAMLALIVPVTVLALASGYQHHRNHRIVAAGALGLALLVLAATYAHSSLGMAAEALITIAGSTVLAIAHVRNMRQCRMPGCALIA